MRGRARQTSAHGARTTLRVCVQVNSSVGSVSASEVRTLIAGGGIILSLE